MVAVPAEPIYRDFGRRLRKAREKATLTQDGLAKRVGLTRTSITNMEHGNQHVGLHLLYRLAKAVGVPPVELLPDESPVSDAGDLAAQLPPGLRRSERVRIEFNQLTPEVQGKVLRLLKKEEASK